MYLRITSHSWFRHRLFRYFLWGCLVQVLLLGSGLAFHKAKGRDWPASKSFAQIFDASHYTYIATDGYRIRHDDTYSSSAFFPLFPAIHALTGTQAWASALVNAAIVAFALALLASALGLGLLEMALLHTLPLAMFYHVPYSEALFMLGTAIAAKGLVEKKNAVAATGLVVLGLTRPVINLLAPGFLLLMVYFLLKKDSRWKLHLKALAISVATMLAVQAFIYSWNGVWLATFKAQKYWGYSLHWPTRSQFANWTEMWFDGPALVVAVLICLLALPLLFNRKWAWPKNTAHFEIMVLAAVLAGMTLFHAIFFKDMVINSLGRYIMAGPPLVLAYSLVRVRLLRPLHFTGFFLLLLGLSIYPFKLYAGLGNLWPFAFFLLYLLLFLLLPSLPSSRARTALGSILLLVGVWLQSLLFSRFLGTEWVG